MLWLRISCCLSSLITAVAPGAAQEPAPGVITEKVVCRNDASQSYALYLPAAYSPGRKWPIVYALDPGARGLIPVQRFKEAAEKYGYIVAGSNNSRNGPIRIVEEAAGALLADTKARFSIDPARVYLAGFSGGARMAVSIAFALKGRVAGVIACGAGFPLSIKPSAAVPFAFFGAAGDEDFNHPELEELDRTLGRAGVPHRFESFRGGHDWPPEAVCADAIEWMQLQAVRSGILKADEARVSEIFEREVSEARSDESEQLFYEAYLRYRALSQDFAGLEDVSRFGLKAKQLGESKEVRKAVALDKDADERQRRFEGKLYPLIEGAAGGEDRELAAQELLGLLAGLRRQADRKNGGPDRLAAVRVVTACWIRLNETAAADLERKDYYRAVSRLKLMAQIRPDNPRVCYQLACASSLAGNRKGAIDALANAVKRGFKDVAAIEANPDLEALRKEPGYQQIIRELSVRK